MKVIAMYIHTGYFVSLCFAMKPISHHMTLPASERCKKQPTDLL